MRESVSRSSRFICRRTIKPFPFKPFSKGDLMEEIDYEEIAAIPAYEKEMEIPVKGLYDKQFIIVKLRDNKYILYRGERQSQRNFIGVFMTLDNVYDAISRRCKKERLNKCQTKLLIN